MSFLCSFPYLPPRTTPSEQPYKKQKQHLITFKILDTPRSWNYMIHTRLKFILHNKIRLFVNYSISLTSHHSSNTSLLYFFIFPWWCLQMHSLITSQNFSFKADTLHCLVQIHWWSTSSILSSLLVNIVNTSQHRHRWSPSSPLVNIVTTS